MKLLRLHVGAMAMLVALWVSAQPGSPDIGFTLVVDENGKPMPGLHAPDMMTRHDLARSGTASWSVEEHFTNANPNEHGRNGEHTWWMRDGVPMRGVGRKRLQFHFMDCWCTEHYIMVYSGNDRMRIDLPDPPAERWALAQHVMARSGYIASPEVIRFRPGRFTFAELMNDTAFDELEHRIAKRLKDDEHASYVKQLKELEEYYRNRPTAPPPSPPPPVLPQGVLADAPGLKSVEVNLVRQDTVWVRITGRVLLDGSCASRSPFFGVEMLTDTGWVERVPIPMVQMDCGMPWADWDDHVVMVPPLRAWIGRHPAGEQKEMVPGSYRLSFMGANGDKSRTEPFTLE